MAMRIKKGDPVKVIAGKDKGTVGKVLRVLTAENKVLVERVNVKTYHKKENAQQAGGRLQKEAPIHISNVAIFNEETNRADRVGFKILDDGQKIRVYKSNGKPIDALGQ